MTRPCTSAAKATDALMAIASDAAKDRRKPRHIPTDIRALLRSPRNAVPTNARRDRSPDSRAGEMLFAACLPLPGSLDPVARGSQALLVPPLTERRSSSERAYSCGAVAAFHRLPVHPGVFASVDASRQHALAV